MEQRYATTVRKWLGPFIRQRVIDITQQDPEEYAEDQQGYVDLHFENGQTVRFYANGEDDDPFFSILDPPEGADGDA